MHFYKLKKKTIIIKNKKVVDLLTCIIWNKIIKMSQHNHLLISILGNISLFWTTSFLRKFSAKFVVISLLCVFNMRVFCNCASISYQQVVFMLS